MANVNVDGGAIHRWRTVGGYSQEEVARFLDIDVRTLNRWLQGKKTASHHLRKARNLLREVDGRDPGPLWSGGAEVTVATTGPQVRSRGGLYLADWQYVETAFGRDYDKIARHLFHLDKLAFPDADECMLCPPTQWSPVLAGRPRAFRLVLTPEKDIVGYALATLVHKDVYPDIRSGRFGAGILTHEKLAFEDIEGDYPLYFASKTLLPEYFKEGKQLILRAVVEILADMARERCFANDFCTNPFAGDWKSLARHLGWVPLGVRNPFDSELYGAGVRATLDSPYVRHAFPELRTLYAGFKEVEAD